MEQFWSNTYTLKKEYGMQDAGGAPLSGRVFDFLLEKLFLVRSKSNTK